jgi:hypothetical protein
MIDIFATTKPKCHFFFAALTALSAQHRVNQNKQLERNFNKTNHKNIGAKSIPWSSSLCG